MNLTKAKCINNENRPVLEKDKVYFVDLDDIYTDIDGDSYIWVYMPSKNNKNIPQNRRLCRCLYSRFELIGE